MAKREITVGSVDQSIDIFVLDSSSTVGAGLAGLAYNSGSLACYYRKGHTGSATALTLATQTVGGAHSDGGFVEIHATNMKGWYRLDLSDTMVAAAGMLSISLHGAANMAPVSIEIEVVAVNKFDAVRMGLTALPNAAADAAGGLPISDAGGLDLDTKLANTNEVTTARMGALTDWINGGRLDLLIDAIKGVTDLLPNGGALTTIGTDTARLTAARAGALTDLVDGGRLDLILDAMKVIIDRLGPSADVIVPGTVDNTAFVTTATEFESDITTAGADTYIGRVVVFRTGVRVQQAAKITDYALVGGRGHFTVATGDLTGAPANGDTFVVV